MIQSKRDLEAYLEADAKNNSFHRMNPVKRFVMDLFVPGGVDPIWNFIRTLRHLEYRTNCKSLWNKLMVVFLQLKFRKLSLKLGFSIPINVFGPGLSIPHYGSIVVNPKAQVGSNCRLHVGVNIGMHKDQAPVIGDNVYIGPGAIVFGGIRVADNVSISANATVPKSIDEANTVVAGTPAKIIKQHARPWNAGR